MIFQIDGWAVCGDRREGLESLHVNGHTETFLDDDGRTRLVLPSTDEVTGGRFETWFWFTEERRGRPNGPRFPGRLDLTRFGDDVVRLLRPMIEVPVVRPRPLPEPPIDHPLLDVGGRTLGFVERRAADAGMRIVLVEEDAPGVRRNIVLGTELLGPDVLRVRVSRGAADPAPEG